MADRGPPANKGESHPFQLTLPKRLYEYLGVLARQSFVGVSETDVASYLLRKKLEKMLKTGFHKIDIPRPD